MDTSGTQESEADKRNTNRIGRAQTGQATPINAPSSSGEAPLHSWEAARTNPYTGTSIQSQQAYVPGSVASSSMLPPSSDFQYRNPFLPMNSGVGPVAGYESEGQGRVINLQPTQSNLPLPDAGMQPYAAPVSNPSTPPSSLQISSPVVNGLTEPPSASQTIAPSNRILNLTPPTATAHSTISPQNGIANGMPVAHGIVNYPRHHRPGEIAAAPMQQVPNSGRGYRENSHLGGLFGSISNAVGRVGDSANHAAHGTLGQGQNKRRTSMLPGQSGVNLK
jgi:hypothetical protein